MKKLIIVSLTLASGNLFAQELRLGDLNFFQKAKSIRVTSDLVTSSGDEEFENKTPGSLRTQKDDFDRVIWQNQILYGIQDRFNAGAAISYALKNEIQNISGTSGGFPQAQLRDYDETGLSDPHFLANYRLSKENIYVDAFGDLRLSIGDREDGRATNLRSEDGNFKSGQHSLLAGLAAGQKVLKDFEWRASLAFDYQAAGKFKYRDISSLNQRTADVDASLDWILSGQGQYRFLDKFAVAANLDIRRVGERDLNYTSSSNVNIDETEDAYNQITLGLTGKWNVTQSILLNAGVRRISAYERDGQIDSNGIVGDTNYEYSAVNEFRIGADLLF